MKYYFDKIENGITYRICLMDFESEPWLCRSVNNPLDEVDRAHGELVGHINGVNHLVYNDIIGNYANRLGNEKATEIACYSVRAYIFATMQAEGWTTFIA